jgi:hypothetical protein
MKKGKVVDMFSKKPLDTETQDTKANDQQAEHGGRYAGNIDKEYARALRTHLNVLNGRMRQIDELIRQWEEDYNLHVDEIYQMLQEDLDIQSEDFNPDLEDVYIDENGHVWFMTRPIKNQPTNLH